MHILPALPVRGLLLLPGIIRVLEVGRPTSVKAIEAQAESGGPLALCFQRDEDVEDPLQAQLSNTGVLAHVLRLSRLPDGSIRVLVEGITRIGVGALKIEDGMTMLDTRALDESIEDGVTLMAQGRQLAEMFGKYLTNQGIPSTDQVLLGTGEEDVLRLADQAASTINMPIHDRVRVLEAQNPIERLELVIQLTAVAITQQRIATEVNATVNAAMDKSQRNYHLKEQLKAIREEMGEAVGAEADADKFQRRILELGMTEANQKEALREAERLRRMHTESAEYSVLRTWLETLCDIPWSTSTPDTTNLTTALNVLDRDHFGLEKVKERVLEYLAVRQLKPDSKGPILCFVGPPGVGKTSLGRSIADALGRKFARISLGGIKDETEVRGHRRTYVGSLPGRIIRAMIRAGTRNPVLLLDELDKVGNDYRGDPASALLEVLDPAQNSTFNDHYVDLPVDLSQVLFIGTANVMATIPPALLDRLEVIEISGYTEEEKVQIARRFVIPKTVLEHGLTGRAPTIPDDALRHLIRDYTREAGLRELERTLAKVHRKVARQVVEGRLKRVRLSPRNLPRYLGPTKYFQELAERVDQPGVVIGLAWTPDGGDILFIEATKMPGKYGLKLTGSLGEVMKESVEAAMSWLRTHALDYGVPATAFDNEFHLHVPAGAIPKDGPSAGVTMVTALASVVTGRCVKHQVAMSGEITLRGKVLPVGGVKEKVLAARQAGVRTILLPKRNATDLDDLPAELRNEVTFHFVETVHEVLAIALEPAKL